MPNKILTIDSLYKFFVEQNQSINFSSKNSGKPIIVSMPANFELSENDMPGMLKIKLKVAHIDTNRNGSHISKENMEKAMPSLKYRPILALIHQLPSGEEDFYAHNMEIVEDENGEEKINYLEKQVGCFTADEPYLEYDKDMDKTYVNAYAVIPEEYTSAADIIRRKNGTKVSCELVINELSYNAKEKYLDLTDFVFGGCTLLGCDEDGCEIGEGMLGSRADIADFCHNEPVFNYQEKLIETLDNLNNTLSNFNTNNTEKGVEKDMNHFEELLEQYGFTADELDFDYENMTDEELDEAFEDFKCRKKKCEEETPVEEDEPITTEEEACGKKKKCEEDEIEEPEVTEENACGGKKKKCSIDENGDMTVSFEISHDDIRNALYILIEEYNEIDNDWYYIAEVYDSYFIMGSWDGCTYYKQSYTIAEDNVTLSGERVQVYSEFITESEKIALDKLRGDYAELEAKYNELKTFKDNYDAAEITAQKSAIFTSEAYDEIRESDEFKALVNEADNYSVQELQDKCDLLFAAMMKKAKFSVKGEKKNSLSVKLNTKENKKSPYGNLFN